MALALRDPVSRRVAIGGLACTGGLTIWAVISGVLNEAVAVGATLQYTFAVVALTVGYLVGREAARPGATIAAVTIAAALWYVLLGGFAYPNADAQLAVQMLALSGVAFVTGMWNRAIAVLALLGFLAITVLESSWAGFITGLAAVIAAVLRPPRSRRAVQTACIAGGGTLAVSAGIQAALLVTNTRPPLLVAALSDVRFDLWNEGEELVRARLWTGHGPGSFAVLSPTAKSDPDLRPAHNAPLEVWAELGLVGLAVLVFIIVAGYLIIVANHSPASLVAVAAWTGLWLHSLVDYVADFPLVLASAGLVLGAGSRPWPDRSARTTPGHPD